MIRTWLQNLRHLNPDCRVAARLLSDQAERELSRFERAGLVLHLAICRACRRYRQSLRFLSRLMREAARTQVAATEARLSDLARERIRLRLEE